MKKLTISLFCLFIFGLNQATAFSYAETEAKGFEIVKMLSTKQFEAISKQVDSAYQSSYPAYVLEKDWAELTGTYGQYKSAKPVNYEVSPYYHFIAFKIQFEYLPYIFNISFNSAGKIIYISFMEAHKIYVAPDYCEVSKFLERKITVVNGMYELPGILSAPAAPGKKPLVIILPEAGPTDKDGSYEENKPYKDLAWGLASKGFAVFRYEKRSNNYGIFLLKDKAAYEKFTPREDLLDDLYKIIDSLKTMDDINPEKIFILGHGQGGMLAPLIAKERKEVAGVIMMGANAKRTQEMMIDQYKYLSKVTPEKKAEYEAQTRNAIRSMNKKLNPLTEHHLMPYDVQATYWIWLNQYPHLDISKRLNKPQFVMHGERDYQANMENYELWKKTLEKNKKATIKLYPRLNHLFYAGDTQSTYSEYYLKSNIPENVIIDISNWLSNQ
ncbi:MAG: dienelactone hydrolase family protein [Sphingobacteriales bacterium]|nr:dienelactone hydrolase family protein [Sphingobacteriales bacterium]